MVVSGVESAVWVGLAIWLKTRIHVGNFGAGDLMDSKVSLLGSGLLAVFVALMIGAASPADAAFGPQLKNCAKVKKAKQACKKQNSDMKRAFGAVANARFTGTYTDGASLDATFCRSGKWRIDVMIPGLEAQVFKGKKWKLAEVTVKKKAIYLNAIGPSRNIFTNVGLHKRGKTWYLSNSSPTSKDPVVTRSGAAGRCKAL